MTYLTILHWFAIIFFIAIFILLVMLSRKEKRKNVFWSMVFASFLVTSMMMVLTIFVLDKYTKKGKLISIKSHRVLRTEDIIFKGKVANVGKFKIGQCKLKIKIVNNPLRSTNLGQGQIFTPSGLEFFKSKDKKKERKNAIEEEFVVVKNLKPRDVKSFTIRMKYPPYFSRSKFIYKLYCR